MSSLASAGLLDRLPSVPNPLSQIKPPRIDERVLSEAEQLKLSRKSETAIKVTGVAHLVTIPLGMIPEPFTSTSAEVSQVAIDTGLKFTKPVLYEPADLQVYPNSTCGYQFNLPQAKVVYSNPFGLWPKLGDDLLLIENGVTSRDRFYPRIPEGKTIPLLNDTPNDFDVLGVPEIYHVNTDVVLSVGSIGDDGTAIIDRNLDTAQNVFFPIGYNALEWRAETQYRPVWDTVVPGAMIPIMMAVEAKFASTLKKIKLDELTKLRGGTIELAHTVGDPAAVLKLVRKLDRQIKFNKLVNNLLVKSGSFVIDKGGGGAAEAVASAIIESVTTVQRSRDQLFTVYDPLPPSILIDITKSTKSKSSTIPTQLIYEATDIGGARSGRYLDDMQNVLVVTDNCGRSVTLVNDAPERLPLGDTAVTWVARDQGPAPPGIDHDDDGIIDTDTFFSRKVTQTITIEDTQAPLMVPPPAIVIVGNTDINLNDYDLGQPLVVDLADLHPVVTSLTDGDGTITPDKRALVTWSATDASANQTTVQQLVTLKTNNTPPTADDITAGTLTSQTKDIVLTANDPDVLPYMNGNPDINGDLEIADPLQFKIEQPPANGEFIAPLLPFFINDYRTDTTGVLTDDLAFAIAPDQMSWLENEYCDKPGIYPDGIPINFVFNPLFVHVTDDGEQYFLDHYAVCDPSGQNDNPPVDSIIRISRWSKDREFLGHIDYNPSGGTHNSSFVLDNNGKIYYLLSFGVNEYSLQSCDSNFTGTIGNCGNSFNFDSNNNGFDISGSTYARVDSLASGVSSDPLIYLTDKNKVAVFQGQVYKSELVNDSGSANFLSNVGVCQPITGGGSNQAYGMEVDSQGNFYIADTCGHRIHKFSPSTFDASNNLVPGEYVGWMGMCTATTNLACDVDKKMSKGFSCTDSTCTGLASGSDIGQFNHPVYLAMDANDVLYVADYTNQRIQRFAPDGTFAGQAKSTGNGINAESDGSFILGNMGPPRHVSVNSKQFFIVDRAEKFVHVFDTSPFKDITNDSATVTYVSNFAFHSDTDVFTYSVNDGLVDSNIAQVSIDVARNYRQPLPTAQTVDVNEDNKVVIILSGTDADGIFNRDFNGLDTLSFVITKQPEYGQLISGGNTNETLDTGMSVWTYIPDQDFHGSDSFSFTVRDAFTDETYDGARLIPQPYGEADAVDVAINIASVNDIPIIVFTPPERIAAGFPIMLQASLEDDTGDNYLLKLDWGDGAIDYNGEVVIDDNNTPNDSTDDKASLTGINFSSESLASIGKSPANALHIYKSTGNRKINLCMKDDGNLETCEKVDVLIEQLAVLSTEVTVPEDLVTDGNTFNVMIQVFNEKPIDGVSGLAAQNVTMKMEVPTALVINSINASQGSCSVTTGILNCNFGTMTNASTVTVVLQASGKNSLLKDTEIALTSVVATDTPALSEEFASSATFVLSANTLDSDADGLSSVFELFYGVTDPAADEDNDGLNNLAESQAGTSPIASDTDGDGINDHDEIAVFETDPLETDSDGDGLSDGDEILIHTTDPNNADSDSDGLPDQWEVDNGFNPMLGDSNGDTDGDGLPTAEEYELGTDHLLADTDADGLTDGDEVTLYSTSPINEDTDNDGLADGIEVTQLTDPLKPDTDLDGLKDGDEVNVYFTRPLAMDTDRDSLPDGWEVHQGRNPLVADYKLAAGGLTSCALTDAPAGLECWGRNLFPAPPAVISINNPVDITVGYSHACIIDTEFDDSRKVTCWGNNTYGQLNVPSMTDPVQVSAGGYHNCALDQVAADQVEVKCWGRDNFNQVSSAPSQLEQPVSLVSSISGSSNCVMDAKSTGPELICWGQYNNANSAVPAGLTGTTGALDLGSEHGCIVDNDNQLCWGLNDDGQAPPGPTTSMADQLSFGGFHSCSLNQLDVKQYAVSCWGLDTDGQATVPSTLIEPIQLAAGSRHSCALDQGNARCWGVENNFDQGQAPAVRQLKIDPDNDGVTTAQEILDGTDPLDPDSDRDQLNDGQEKINATDPLSADTDDDGVSDADEVSVYSTDPLKNDSDNDGMADGWEIANGLQPMVDDSASDNDGDNLTNGQEFSYDTDPNMADTDDDGINDANEIATFIFKNSGQSLGSAISEAVKLGDLDGDGDLDAFIANRIANNNVWINDGTGTFTLSTDNVLANSQEAYDVDLADVDGDGDLDAFTAGKLWLNGTAGDPQGIFRDSGQVFQPGSYDAVKFGKMKTTNELPDLYVANWGKNDAYGNFGDLFNDTFILSPFIFDQLNGNSEDVALGDLNGDGFNDAFVVNREQSNQLFIAQIDTEPNMSGAALLIPPAFSIGVDLGDMDGDGDLDVFVANVGANQILQNNGLGTITDSGQSIGINTSNDVSLIDIDGDGDLDAIVANTGANKLWLNSGNGTMLDSGMSMGSATSLGLSTGDVDGDGDSDLVFANDGPNTVWLFSQLDPNEPDSDGDGADDGWEVAHGYDPLDVNDGSFDNDIDGLSNADEFLAQTDPNISDSDMDGMPDGWEVTFGLDPTIDDSLDDIDADGVNNLAEYQQNLSPQIDDVPPVILLPLDVTVNSTGVLTAVTTGVASATDAKTGAATTSVNNAGPFASGHNVITWSASDLFGNTMQGEQIIDVVPLLNFAIDQIVAEGAIVQANIQLNGAAVNYPVSIDYSVSGVATNPEDHNAATGTVTIDNGSTFNIPIDIVNDTLSEGEESFSLKIDSVSNAVLGAKTTHTLTIVEKNIIPTITIIVSQQGKTVTTATVDGGLITIMAVISDPNPGDTHSIDWSVSDSGVFDPADHTDTSYSIDPLSLNEGVYKIVVNVADNGSPIETNSAESMLRIVTTAPILSVMTDSDGDGINDFDEGAADQDSDGVPDYLDANDASNILRLSDDGYLLETQVGLSLRLGVKAFVAGAVSSIAESEISEDFDFAYPNGVADFEILGVQPGKSVMVVVPLHYTIPADASYRKYIDGIWQNFVTDSGNIVFSAAGGNGACPAPGASSYITGLNPGDSCIQLQLQDGGLNDADGLANGVIVDPGGLAVPDNTRLEILPVNNQSVSLGSKNNVVLALRIISDSGGVELDSLTLQATGSGDERQIIKVSLFIDTNSNKIVDPEEVTIGSGSFSQNDGSLTLQMATPYTLQPGKTDLLVTFDF